MHKNSPQILCILPIDTKSQLCIVYKSEGKTLCILPNRQNRPPLFRPPAFVQISQISLCILHNRRKFGRVHKNRRMFLVVLASHRISVHAKRENEEEHHIGQCISIYLNINCFVANTNRALSKLVTASR